MSGYNSWIKRGKLGGMTLVELIVSLSILVIVMSAGMALLYALLSFNKSQQKLLDDELNVRSALLRITQEIHRWEPGGADITSGDNILILPGSHDYRLIDECLTDNGVTIAEGITGFRTQASGTPARTLEITISGGRAMTVSTKIKILRGESGSVFLQTNKTPESGDEDGTDRP